MIKSFFDQILFCFAIPEPHLLTLAKTDYPSTPDENLKKKLFYFLM